VCIYTQLYLLSLSLVYYTDICTWFSVGIVFPRQKGELAKAVKKYLIVIKWLDDDENFSEEQKAPRISLRLAAHLNCALCYIKQEKWPEAKMQCNEALSFDEQSEKALFRRGQVRCNACEGAR